jgi:copper chaperone CopZ
MADIVPEAGEHTYKFNVSMSCGGCSGAVDRVLKRLDGALPPSPTVTMTKY